MDAQPQGSGNQRRYSMLSTPLRYRTFVGIHLGRDKGVGSEVGAQERTIETVDLGNLPAFVIPS